MFRFLVLAALGLIVCIVSYVPSKVLPAEITQVLVDEQRVVAGLWGDEVAARIKGRAQRLQETSTTVMLESSPSGPPRTARPDNTVDAAIVRLFGSSYVQSIDALLTLVSYRLSTALELVPTLLVFALVVGIDGAVARVVRSQELVAHSAEHFSASLATGLLLVLGVVTAWFVPVVLHPMGVLAVLLVVLHAMGRALANYHLLR